MSGKMTASPTPASRRPTTKHRAILPGAFIFHTQREGCVLVGGEDE